MFFVSASSDGTIVVVVCSFLSLRVLIDSVSSVRCACICGAILVDPLLHAAVSSSYCIPHGLESSRARSIDYLAVEADRTGSSASHFFV